MTTSAPWEILIAGPARKSLERVPSSDRERIEAALEEMAANPFQGDIKLLKGQEKRFRRRVGAWRIFFFRWSQTRSASLSRLLNAALRPRINAGRSPILFAGRCQKLAEKLSHVRAGLDTLKIEFVPVKGKKPATALAHKRAAVTR